MALRGELCFGISADRGELGCLTAMVFALATAVPTEKRARQSIHGLIRFSVESYAPGAEHFKWPQG